MSQKRLRKLLHHAFVQNCKISFKFLDIKLTANQTRRKKTVQKVVLFLCAILQVVFTWFCFSVLQCIQIN